MRFLILAAALLAVVPGLRGSDVAVGYSSNASTVIVADGETRALSFHDREGHLAATREGLRHPRKVVVSESRFAILDPIDNLLIIGDARERTGRTLKVSGSPSIALFSRGSLIVVLKDQNSLLRVDGEVTQTVACERDPSLIGERAGKIYVYSRVPGTLTEYDATTLAETRRLALPPYASSMAISGKKVLMTYPETGEIRTVNLDAMSASSAVRIGSTPVDIILTGSSSLLSPESFAVADPGMKRIWKADGEQSLSEAVGRGFLRGLIGLGLSSPGSAEFPTGIDRLWAAGDRLIALDSSEGILYETTRGKSRRIATGVDASAVAVSSDRVFVWNSATHRLELVGTK